MASSGLCAHADKKPLVGIKMSCNKKQSSNHKNGIFREIASESVETKDRKILKMKNSEENDDGIQRPEEKEFSFATNPFLRNLKEGPFKGIASELFLENLEVFDSKKLMDEMHQADDRLRLASTDLTTKAITRLVEISEEAKWHLEEIKSNFETLLVEDKTAEEMERLIKKFIDKYRELTLSCLYAQEKTMNSLIKEWLRANCYIIEKSENNGNLKGTNIRSGVTETCKNEPKNENICLKLVIFAAIMSNAAYSLISKESPFKLTDVQLYFSYLKERIVTLFNYFIQIPNSTSI